MISYMCGALMKIRDFLLAYFSRGGLLGFTGKIQIHGRLSSDDIVHDTINVHNGCISRNTKIGEVK